MDAVQPLIQGTCKASINRALAQDKKIFKVRNFKGTLAKTWKIRKSTEVVRAAGRDIYDVMIAAFLSRTLDHVD